jgi:Uma2 family endonuclease
MTIISELPELMLRSIDATWDRARWELLPDDGNRYEVIDGVLYMTTAPSFFHQWIIRQIFLALYPQIDETGVGLTIWSPIGVFMPHCDPVQPDILIIRTTDLGIIHDRRIEGVPALIVEVLSPGNQEKDTDTKRKAYARAGLPEYWIVRPSSRDVLVYTSPDQPLGDYSSSQKVGPDDEIASPTLPIRVAINTFFAGAPDTTL